MSLALPIVMSKRGDAINVLIDPVPLDSWMVLRQTPVLAAVRNAKHIRFDLIVELASMRSDGTIKTGAVLPYPRFLRVCQDETRACPPLPFDRRVPRAYVRA